MAKVETQYKTVKMDDERIVDFAGKRKMLKESIVESNGTVNAVEGTLKVRLDFVNGESRLFTLPAALIAKFALHGAEQKLGDEIAGLEDVEDAIMAIDELTERLNKGEWAVKRDSNGLAGASILAKALAEVSGKPIADIKTFLKSKTHAEKVALRGNDKVAPVIARLESEKVKKASTIDTGSLLNELETGVAASSAPSEAGQAAEAEQQAQ